MRDKMKFGVSSLVFLPEPLQSSMEKIVEAHFDAWEIVCEGHHQLTPENVKYLRELKDCYDVDIVVHAPFSDLNPASMNSRVRKLTVQCIGEAIEGASELDGKVVVVHPGYVPPLWSNYIEEIRDNNYSTLIEILEVAEDHKIMIGLENMPYYSGMGILGTTLEDIKGMVEGIDSKYLGITFDIGHAHTVVCNNVSKCKTLEDFIYQLDRIGRGIVHVHCHDNRGKVDEHLKLGDGNIDFLRVFKALKDIGYSDIITFESKNLRDAIKSREVASEIISNLL